MTNGLLSFDPPTATVTMSSREIADLTGKRHPDVVRDLKGLMLELEKDVSSFARIYVDAMNRSQTEYALPKRETLILVSGYSARMRAAIIDRWQELETRASAPQHVIPQTLGEALQLAADIERKREEAQALADQRKVYIEQYKENERQDLALIENQATKIKQLIPAKKFQETFEENGSDMSFRELAKWLCAGGTAITEPDLSAFLKSRDIMYRLKGKYVPYKQYESTEYFRYTINCAGFGEWAITAAGAVWIKDWIDRARDRKTAA